MNVRLEWSGHAFRAVGFIPIREDSSMALTTAAGNRDQISALAGNHLRSRKTSESLPPVVALSGQTSTRRSI
jgi:hypothetical protein